MKFSISNPSRRRLHCRLLLDSLKGHVRDRHAMLDNFEQIISAAPLLSELLSACAGLRLRGEQELPEAAPWLPPRPC